MTDQAEGATRSAAAGLLCPICRVDLTMAERQGVEIDYCPKCRGVWLDRGELDKIIERSAAESAQAQPAPPADPYGRPGYDSRDPYYDSHHGHHGHHGGHHGGHHRSFLRDLFG